MIKRTLLAAAIFSALPAYAGLTSITAGYDFTDYSGDHGFLLPPAIRGGLPCRLAPPFPLCFPTTFTG